MQAKGMDGFSARAVAEACHVSCAAPFKYFKGKREFLLAISKRLDRELLTELETIRDARRAENPDAAREASEALHKALHMDMNEAFIRFLCRYPFLGDSSFWHTIDEGHAGIRRWESFGLMTEQFRFYSEQRGVPEEVYRAYYFNFQTLAYGSAFVINNGLVLEGEQPELRIQELQRRIYENLERTVPTRKEDT